jgi:transposase
MNKLEDVDIDVLHDALADASSVKAAKRLMIALSYADDMRVETLSARYDIPRATVYSWFDRFEHQSISKAIEDESRPGRPAKLNASHRERLSDDLAGSPAELGYNTSKWTPQLVQSHIERVYDVTYLLGYVCRLLRESSTNT